MTNRLDKSNCCTNADGPSIQQFVFTCITLFIVLILIYGNSFQTAWHYDDFTNIVENTNIQIENLSWNELKKVAYKNRPNREFNNRPLAYLTFAINYYISGLDVFSYHAVNFTVHCLASICLYLFIFQTMNLPIVKRYHASDAHSVALLSVFLWAAHPMQVTAVTYIVQRMASMAGLFYIMSMYFYLRARTSEGRHKNAWYVPCCVAGLLSFTTKENAAMLPFSLFLYDLLLLQSESSRKHILNNFKKIVLPVCIIAVLAFLYTDPLSVLSGYKNRPFTPIERLMTQPRVIIFYISLLLYPASPRLALLHDIEISSGLFAPWTTLPSIVLVAGLIFFLMIMAKKHPLLSFCGLFFFMNHIIEGSIFNLEPIYEHRNYLPSMLFFVIISLFLLRVLKHFSYSKPLRALIVFSIVIILICNSHTVHFRNHTFINAETLWRDTAAKSPGMSVVHINLGKSLWNKGKSSEAMDEYRKALSLNHYMNLTQIGVAHYNSGLYYAHETKNYQKALFHFEKALEIVDGRPEIWAEAARTNLILGNRQKALENVQFALKHWPEDPDLLNGLSLIQYKSGETDKAFNTAQKILFARSDADKPLILLAEISSKRGNIKKAIKYWENLLEKNPSHIRGTLALIELYYKTDQYLLLDQMIGRLIYLKKDKGFYETIVEARQPENIKAYLPDTAKILPIIREHLIKQANNIDIISK